MIKKNFWRSLIPQNLRASFQKKVSKPVDEKYDLSRFDEQDIILENENQIQEFLPDILGQALARTWIDRRFLEAFYEQPVEILEKAGVFLPKSISIEFSKDHLSLLFRIFSEHITHQEEFVFHNQDQRLSLVIQLFHVQLQSKEFLIKYELCN